MPERKDVEVIDAARLQHARLGAALLFGGAGQRRTVANNLRRMMASVIIAAVACAGCAGVSIVSHLLAQQQSSVVTRSLPRMP